MSVGAGAKNENMLSSIQVGLDLVDVQIDLKYVDSSIAKRVTWLHVNL